jgi:hypothetical protein
MFVTPMLFALFLVLLTLKLLRKINLSWFWVTAPAWFPWVALLVPPFLYAAFTGNSLYTH